MPGGPAVCDGCLAGGQPGRSQRRYRQTRRTPQTAPERSARKGCARWPRAIARRLGPHAWRLHRGRRDLAARLGGTRPTAPPLSAAPWNTGQMSSVLHPSQARATRLRRYPRPGSGGVRSRAQHLRTLKCRPPWHPGTGSGWMRFPIARPRHTQAIETLTLYWSDRHLS